MPHDDARGSGRTGVGPVAMPLSEPGNLPPEQYRAVTVFLLNANGYPLPPSTTEDALAPVKRTPNGH